jgi:hypothetical protein
MCKVIRAFAHAAKDEKPARRTVTAACPIPIDVPVMTTERVAFELHRSGWLVVSTPISMIAKAAKTRHPVNSALASGKLLVAIGAIAVEARKPPALDGRADLVSAPAADANTSEARERAAPCCRRRQEAWRIDTRRRDQLAEGCAHTQVYADGRSSLTQCFSASESGSGGFIPWMVQKSNGVSSMWTSQR